MRILLILIPGILFAQAAQSPPAAAKRGQKLFFDEGPKCATCHIAEGKGNKVGPDLSRLAQLTPRGLKMSVLATATEYVVIAKLKSGQSFPAMRAGQADTSVKLWDLSKPVPELKEYKKEEIQSYEANATWKHPPASAGLTAAELADILSYVKFAAYGDRRGVKAADIE